MLTAARLRYQHLKCDVDVKANTQYVSAHYGFRRRTYALFSIRNTLCHALSVYVLSCRVSCALMLWLFVCFFVLCLVPCVVSATSAVAVAAATAVTSYILSIWFTMERRYRQYHQENGNGNGNAIAIAETKRRRRKSSGDDERQWQQ